MKLNFHKFLMAIATVGAVALAGCSDGTSTTPATVATAAISTTVHGTDTVSIDKAKKFALAVVGTPLSIPAVTATLADGTPQVIPASTLTFQPSTSGTTDTKLISGFKLVSADGTTVTGDLIAGSCIFKPLSVTGSANSQLATAFLSPGGSEIPLSISPCGFSVETAGLTIGGTTDKTVTITLGGAIVSTTEAVAVDSNGFITIGGVSTGIAVKFVTGTTGAAG